MFSANSPTWANGVNNPGAATAAYTGVSDPLGLSNNNAFGRVWPANAPFGDGRSWLVLHPRSDRAAAGARRTL